MNCVIKHLSRMTLKCPMSWLALVDTAMFIRQLTTSAPLLLLLVALLRAPGAGLSSADTSVDAIRPSADRFPAFVMAGHVHAPHGGAYKEAGYPPPRRSQLRIEALAKKLGTDFDSHWMSIDRPVSKHSMRHSNVSQVVSVTNIDSDLTADLSRLNFTYVDEDTGELRSVKPAVRKHIEKWLLLRASCPVRMSWVNLGDRFWPRWVRQGRCDDSAAASCSWPPGMHCVAKAPRTLRLLTWRCQTSRRHHRGNSGGGGSGGGGGGGGGGGVGSSQPSARTVAGGGEGVKRPVGASWRVSAAGSAGTVGGRGRGTSHVQQRTTGNGKEMYCRWRKVRYMVTDECYCSC